MHTFHFIYHIFLLYFQKTTVRLITLSALYMKWYWLRILMSKRFREVHGALWKCQPVFNFDWNRTIWSFNPKIVPNLVWINGWMSLREKCKFRDLVLEWLEKWLFESKNIHELQEYNTIFQHHMNASISSCT